MTALATGIGGIALGLLPEARLRAAPVQATTTTTVDTSEPPSQPLPIETQNAMYASALNDAGVALLVGSLGVAGRVDPPQESCELALSNGARPRTVVLPVSSYADGSRLAVLFYGADANAAASDNAAPTLTGIVSKSGKVQYAVGGQLYDSPNPQWNDIYMAKYFPDQYLAAGVQATTPTTTSQRSDAPKRRFAAWRERSGWRMQKTNQAGGDPNPGLAPCIAGCMTSAQGCLAAITSTIGLGALVMAFWCGTCVILAVGAGVTTGGIATGVIITRCAYACLWTAGAMASLLLALTACQTAKNNCVANCNLQFPSLPPAPPPSGDGPPPLRPQPPIAA
jgi:hypothetical protein